MTGAITREKYSFDGDLNACMCIVCLALYVRTKKYNTRIVQCVIARRCLARLALLSPHPLSLAIWRVQYA